MRKSIQAGVSTVRRCPFHSSKGASAAIISNEDPKNYMDIPGPRGLPFFGSALEFLVSTRHKILEKRSQDYGPIFRERVGPMQSVNLCDPVDVEHVLRNEGKHPHRLEVPPWRLYRKLRGLPFGLVIANGPEWQKARSAVNKPMMRQKLLHRYLDDMDNVVEDVIKRFLKHRQPDLSMKNLDEEFFHWSIESVGTVMLECRLGCLADDRPTIASDFVNSVRAILSPNKLLFVFPELAWKLGLPSWKKHERAWDKIYEIGKSVISERRQDMEEQRKNGKEVEGVLASLLENKEMQQNPALVNTLVTDLFLGAVDTSPNTMLFTLLLLAKNVEKQEKLREEILAVVDSKTPIRAEQLQAMPYLKAVFKESLRMYPIVPTFGKIYNEDIMIRGFKIPAKTMVNVVCCAMGRDPKLFKDPEEFRPERWLKDSPEREDIHPFSSIPFGFGVRSCIGRRIAEMQMYLLLARLIQTFDVQSINPIDQTKKIEAQVQLLMHPKEKPDIRFAERK